MASTTKASPVEDVMLLDKVMFVVGAESIEKSGVDGHMISLQSRLHNPTVLPYMD
jgi:hypothetical protein